MFSDIDDATDDDDDDKVSDAVEPELSFFLIPINLLLRDDGDFT